MTENSLNFIYYKGFSISIEEKFLLPFYLKFSLLSSLSFTSLDSRFTFNSFFNFYDKCLESLWYVSVSPYLEYNSDRNSFGFRPYRRSEDVFFHVKNIYCKNIVPYMILKIKFNLFLALGLDSQNWFINSYGNNKSILKDWLKRIWHLKIVNHSINESNLIFISALKYSVNGLV